MIDTVHGILESREEDSIRVNIGAVGLEIITPKPAAIQLGGIGSKVTLYTHVHIKDENITLFGFKDIETRALFRSLNEVSGVGPRLALAVLSSINTQSLYSAIESEDAQALQEIPGIGKRTASRIIVDLKGKLPEVSLSSGTETIMKPTDADLSIALRGLGYSAIEIRDAVSTMDIDVDMQLEERIRNALQIISSKNEI
tara:strand:+ start:166 stop:762 length:597 start_codon:yes stop_codon:yes gene_type:complete